MDRRSSSVLFTALQMDAFVTSVRAVVHDSGLSDSNIWKPPNMVDAEQLLKSQRLQRQEPGLGAVPLSCRRSLAGSHCLPARSTCPRLVRSLCGVPNVVPGTIVDEGGDQAQFNAKALLQSHFADAGMAVVLYLKFSKAVALALWLLALLTALPIGLISAASTTVDPLPAPTSALQPLQLARWSLGGLATAAWRSPEPVRTRVVLPAALGQPAQNISVASTLTSWPVQDQRTAARSAWPGSDHTVELRVSGSAKQQALYTLPGAGISRHQAAAVYVFACLVGAGVLLAGGLVIRQGEANDVAALRRGNLGIEAYTLEIPRVPPDTGAAELAQWATRATGQEPTEVVIVESCHRIYRLFRRREAVFRRLVTLHRRRQLLRTLLLRAMGDVRGEVDLASLTTQAIAASARIAQLLRGRQLNLLTLASQVDMADLPSMQTEPASDSQRAEEQAPVDPDGVMSGLARHPRASLAALRLHGVELSCEGEAQWAMAMALSKQGSQRKSFSGSAGADTKPNFELGDYDSDMPPRDRSRSVLQRTQAAAGASLRCCTARGRSRQLVLTIAQLESRLDKLDEEEVHLRGKLRKLLAEREKLLRARRSWSGARHDTATSVASSHSKRDLVALNYTDTKVDHRWLRGTSVAVRPTELGTAQRCGSGAASPSAALRAGSVASRAPARPGDEDGAGLTIQHWLAAAGQAVAEDPLLRAPPGLDWEQGDAAPSSHWPFPAAAAFITFRTPGAMRQARKILPSAGWEALCQSRWTLFRNSHRLHARPAPGPADITWEAYGWPAKDKAKRIAVDYVVCIALAALACACCAVALAANSMLADLDGPWVPLQAVRTAGLAQQAAEANSSAAAWSTWAACLSQFDPAPQHAWAVAASQQRALHVPAGGDSAAARACSCLAAPLDARAALPWANGTAALCQCSWLSEQARAALPACSALQTRQAAALGLALLSAVGLGLVVLGTSLAIRRTMRVDKTVRNAQLSESRVLQRLHIRITVMLLLAPLLVLVDWAQVWSSATFHMTASGLCSGALPAPGASLPPIERACAARAPAWSAPPGLWQTAGTLMVLSLSLWAAGLSHVPLAVQVIVRIVKRSNIQPVTASDLLPLYRRHELHLPERYARLLALLWLAAALAPGLPLAAPIAALGATAAYWVDKAAIVHWYTPPKRESVALARAASKRVIPASLILLISAAVVGILDGAFFPGASVAATLSAGAPPALASRLAQWPFVLLPVAALVLLFFVAARSLAWIISACKQAARAACDCAESSAPRRSDGVLRGLTRLGARTPNDVARLTVQQARAKGLFKGLPSYAMLSNPDQAKLLGLQSLLDPQRSGSVV